MRIKALNHLEQTKKNIKAIKQTYDRILTIGSKLIQANSEGIQMKKKLDAKNAIICYQYGIFLKKIWDIKKGDNFQKNKRSKNSEIRSSSFLLNHNDDKQNNYILF